MTPQNPVTNVPDPGGIMCDDAEGIVSQISNMLTGLTRKED